MEQHATAGTNDSHPTTELRVLKPWIVECRCGARLRLAMEWTVFRCGKCGTVTKV